MLWKIKQSSRAARPPWTIALLLALVPFAVALLALALFFSPTAAWTEGRLASALPATTGSLAPVACQWSLLPSPNLNQYNELNAVGALSTTNVWAAGSRGDGNVGQLTLIEQWNGSVWSVVPSPNPGNSDNDLLGMAALSDSNVWAAGYYRNTSGASQTMVLHWDGSAWTQVNSPSPASILNELHDIDAVSANDIWAVGLTWGDAPRRRTLIEHWNGTEWSVVPAPNVGDQDNHLTAVDARAANDVWAAGYYVSGAGTYGTLMLHWDGVQWTVVPTPNPPDTNSFLNSVSAASAGDAWAVGYSCAGNCFGTNTKSLLTMHWDGADWTIVQHTVPGSLAAQLSDVLALSGNDAWAVGQYTTASSDELLTLHWDGAQWTQVAAPNPTTTTPSLYRLAALSSNDIWAVGAYHFPGVPVFRTLTEHYGGDCPASSPTPAPPTTPSATSTAMATPTVAQPTATRTATSSAASPTGTRTATAIATATAPAATSTTSPGQTSTATAQPPTATPTACTVSFIDVPPDHTFYPYIQGLACRGLVSGYPDNTFRPGENLTRGQLSKIVANSAGWNEPVSGQDFADVPPGSTFYEFVGRMVLHDAIQGYPCGGPGEPCVAPGNLPYFRPGNNASRGQISKIVSNAKGFADPAGEQIFEDVAPGSPFYDYIQRLASRGYMGGYPCGGVGEPCVAPSNLPYFRPGNNVTRGQAAKIVFSAFFGSPGR